MNLSALISPILTTALGATALVYTILRWSLFDQNLAIIGTSWEAGARLLVGALTLTWIGHSIFTIASRRFRALQCLAFTSLSTISSLIVSLAAGEVVCLVWALFRAGVSGVSYWLFDLQAPITMAEVGILLGTLAIERRQPKGELHTGRDLRAPIPRRSIVGFAALLMISLLPIALRELPREISLSSDPDQHSFWASQVLRLGGIPWDQGILGIGSFGYPAGFAVLNATWCLFSGLSPIEMVAIQPILQFILAALLCAVGAEYSLKKASPLSAAPPRSLDTAFICLLLVATYWAILPYGYQLSMYHGEGGGRAATPLLMAIIAVGLVSIWGSPMSSTARRLWFASLGFATTLVVAVNPVTGIFPLLLVGAVGLYELGRSLSALRLPGITAVGIVPLMLIGLVCAAFAACDPYIAEKIPAAITLTGQHGATTVTPPTSLGDLTLTLPAESFIPWIMPSRLCAFLVGGVFPPEFFTPQLYVVLSALALWWIATSPRSALRFALVLFSVSVVFYLSLGIPRGGDADRPIYLIQPYIMQSLMQFGCVLGAMLLATGALAITMSARHWGSALVLGAVVAFVATADASMVTYNRFFNIKPRREYCGSLGCISEGDRAALAFVRTLGADLLAKYHRLSYEDAPKIMIPTHPADLGTEEWLFPFGASRILPIESPLPVAFFYGRGSPQWTFDNYRKHVCSQFDIEWLRRRNVRFLFIPAHNPGCIRGRNRVIGDSTILFERDGTKVIKLF